jgi:type I restriction enzyme S subunit
MNDIIKNEWYKLKFRDYLSEFPKSKNPSGISHQNGPFKFYVCSQNIFKSFKSEMNEEAILLSTGGEASIHFATGKYSYSTDVWAIKSSGALINSFAYRCLEFRLKQINYAGFQGSGIRHLDKEFIKKLEFLVPTVSEQKKITSILTSVDDVIEKTQSQINKLQDLKKATMNELLTKGIGHTDFKDSELGRIPKSWKITELSKVSMILSSNVDKKTIENETLVSLCNYMDVYKNLIITREINFMKASAKKSEINKFLIKKDDVIITKDSETPDDIAISSYVSEDFDNVLCGYHLSIIRSNKSVVDGKFLSLFFKLDYTRHRFSILANGTTRFGLNLKEIENSKILVPSLEEQKKIANIIFSLDDEISTITKKFNKYFFLKKSLMQDLLTGKVRVSVN